MREGRERRTWLLSALLYSVMAFALVGLVVQACGGGKSSAESACERFCNCFASAGSSFVSSYEASCMSSCMSNTTFQSLPQGCFDCLNSASDCQGVIYGCIQTCGIKLPN